MWCSRLSGSRWREGDLCRHARLPLPSFSLHLSYSCLPQRGHCRCSLSHPENVEWGKGTAGGYLSQQLLSDSGGMMRAFDSHITVGLKDDFLFQSVIWISKFKFQEMMQFTVD